MSIITVDPGHGGKDRGAVAPNVTEAEINLAFARTLAGELVSRGHSITMTRSTDCPVSLDDRCWVANVMKADLFVSVHHNASPHIQAHGFEVLYYPGSIAAGLAASLDAEIANRFRGQMKARGAKARPDLYVLRHTAMPAVLLEVGFISNPFEGKLLMMEHFQSEMAGALAGVIDSWLMGDYQ